MSWFNPFKDYLDELGRSGERPLRSSDELDQEDRESERALRVVYAGWLLRLLAVQLIFTDTVFVAYAILGPGWDMPASVVIGFLTTSVVEMVGAVGIVSHYLFRHDPPISN